MYAKFSFCLPFVETSRVRPLMVPLLSLLGNAGKPPHPEAAKHTTGQMMTSGLKDMAVQAPDGSLGQIGNIRSDQMGEPGIAPMPANKSVGQNSIVGQDNTRNEIRRDYGPLGQPDVNAIKPVKQEDPELEDRDQVDDAGQYPNDKDEDSNAQQPLKVRTCFQLL